MNNILRGIKLVFSLDRKRFIINYGIFILEAFFSVVAIYILKVTLEKLGLFVFGKLSITEMIFCMSIFILVKIIMYAFKSFMGFYCEYYDLILGREIENLLQNKKFLPIFYEDKKFLDLLSQAKKGSLNLSYITNAYLDVVFMYGANFLFLSIYLFYLSPYFILTLIVIMIFQILHNKFDKGIEEKLEESLKNIRRKREYFENLFLEKESVKEIKSLNTTEYFLNKFNFLIEKFCHISETFYKKLLFNDFRMGILKIICYIISYFIVYIYKNSVSIAEFSAVFVTMKSIFSLSEEGFYERIKEVNSLLPQLNSLFKVLDIKCEANITLSNEIIFKNVYFKYPNSNEYALKNINFKISTNEKIAIVGINGSGKSTISKLILGLYKPSSGEIETVKSSSVFQDFVKYELSSIENVKISDCNKEVDKLKFKEIDYIDESELDYNKIISKRFSDISLSQGQWQKLAILRGIHKDENFFVFDEPTWAIDPIVEKKIFDFLYNSIKTGMIVITHNLSSVRQMDKIMLVDNGRLLDFDTHSNLIHSNEIYKKMWFSSID